MMYMRNACLKALLLALAVTAWATSINQAQAQQETTLINFNSTWRYNNSGTDLGTAWRATSYPAESSWATGQGVLGVEDAGGLNAYQATAPFNTQFSGYAQSTITYYFRATFNYSGSPNAPGLQLFATNLVDDGCVIYLNGSVAGSIRMPTSYTYTTLASGGPATEGQRDVVTISPSLLRSGINTVAVEVHQSSTTSSDVAFGMKLIALAPQQLVITSQPQSQTVAAGERVEFSVGVQGGPAVYRWQKDGVNLPSASNSFVITSAQVANAGNYRVIITNTLGAVTSSVATLTVTADTDGPQVVRAVIDNGFGSNSVNVVFNEVLNSASARTASNYRLVPKANTNISIQIANVLYSSALGALIQVSTNESNWNPEGEYFLVLNRVTDSRGNNIAPYTRVPVSVPIIVNLSQMSDTWNYYDFNFFDPNGINIYTNTVNPWYGTNYTIDNNWGTSQGIFYFDSDTAGVLCAGDTLGRQLSFQEEPTLFRRTFTMPPDMGDDGNFRLRFMVDDGLVVFLNGTEIYRNNMPAGNLTYLSKAINAVGTPTCITNVTVPVSGLKVGTNVLAAAVYQASTSAFDVYFGLEMDGVFLRTPEMPIKEPAANLLRLTQTYSRATRAMVMSWPTNFSGFSLYEKSDLSPNSPWTQVKDQSNPYTNTVPSTEFRFYEIRKP